jgi:hypothetical protein
MYRLHIHQIIEHDALLQLGNLLEKLFNLLHGAHVLAGANRNVDGGLTRPDEAKGCDEAEPTTCEIRALVAKAGADDADAMAHGCACNVSSFEVIEHGVVRPLDVLVRVVAMDVNAVQVTDMLHIGSVGTYHPRIDRNNLAEILVLKTRSSSRIGVWSGVEKSGSS